MLESIADIHDIGEDTSVLIYGSYVEKGMAADDIDLIVVTDEDLGELKQSFGDIDWPLRPDPMFLSEDEFETRSGLKDFKLATALNKFEVVRSGIELGEAQDMIYEDEPGEEAVMFNFYKALDSWDKSRIFLQTAKNYSRRGIEFETDMDLDDIYTDSLHELENPAVRKNLLDSSASLSFAAGYLSAADAYEQGEPSYHLEEAVSGSRNDIEQQLMDIKRLQYEQKDGYYQPDLLEDYLGELGEYLESSELNSLFE